MILLGIALPGLLLAALARRTADQQRTVVERHRVDIDPVIQRTWEAYEPDLKEQERAPLASARLSGH